MVAGGGVCNAVLPVYLYRLADGEYAAAPEAMYIHGHFPGSYYDFSAPVQMTAEEGGKVFTATNVLRGITLGLGIGEHIRQRIALGIDVAAYIYVCRDQYLGTVSNTAKKAQDFAYAESATESRFQFEITFDGDKCNIITGPFLWYTLPLMALQSIVRRAYDCGASPSALASELRLKACIFK